MDRCLGRFRPHVGRLGVVAVGLVATLNVARGEEVPTPLNPGEDSTTASTPETDRQLGPRPRPRYDPADELSAAPGRGVFRGVTLGVAGQLVFTDDVVDEPAGPRRIWTLQGTPSLDALAEIGGRRIRFVAGAYTAPVAILDYDFLMSTYFGLRVGFLAGNEKVRGGVIVGGGYYAWEAMAHLFVTPWRDRFGNRHGLAAGAGVFFARFPTVSLGYRFAPARLNHLGGRRRAIRRTSG